MSTIPRTDLLAALDAVKGAVAAKPFNPILTHVLVANDHVLGFDGEVGIRVRLTKPLGVTFNVRFDVFHSLLSKLSGEDVSVEPTKEGRAVRVACGGHASVLEQIAEDFPKPVIGKVDWRDVPPGFQEAVGRALVASAAEKDQSMSGVYVEGSRLYATDRVRVVRCSVEGLDSPPLMLPTRAAEEVVRLGAPKRMAVSAGAASLVVFDYLTLIFVARLKDIPEGYPGGAKFDTLFDGDEATGRRKREASAPVPEGLAPALARLLLFVDPAARAATVEEVVAEGDAAVRGVRLACQGATSSVEEVVWGEVGAFELKKFDPSKLAEALRHADGIDWGASPEETVYVRGGVAGFEMVLAPVRV